MANIQSVTYESVVAVTQSDTVNDPAGPFAALQATTMAGLAKVRDMRGNDTTISLPAGEIVKVAVLRVWSTGTSATGIVGFSVTPYRQPINPGNGEVH